MNNSKQKDTILVKVCRIDDGSNEYVVEYQDKIYRVAQLPYQRELDTPSELRCIVEYSREGIHIKQDLEYLIGEFYKKGDVAEFKIQRTATDYHLLQEEHGFTAKIAKELVPNPALTPILRCRITGIYSKGVKVELVQKLLADTSGFSLTQNILKDYIGDTPWNNESLRLLLLDNNINLDLFDSECHKWLVKMAEGMGSEELVTNLKNLREHLLNALESSMMLDECADINERTLIENRFSDMIEQTSYYSYAIDFVNKGNAKGEIDAILGRLDTSCFLYHPNKNFYILLCIFLLDFDLMDENMPRILNILRGHNIAIWKRKPFRTLWIKLLEYYISTNYKRPDLLISDNETVRVMIQALIMQLNLSDGGQSSLFDATLNRTILYRLCSRMNVLEPQKLVDEALFNLISDSNVNTLYSIDSDDSELLANIISNQVSDVLNANTDSVCYNTEKAKILIKSGNISISADTMAITIEGLCYMPAFGIADAATTLVGQSIGAGRKKLAKKFGNITVATSMIVLTVMSTIMFITAKFLMSLMTDNQEIIDLGTEILRIEAFSEPFFGAAIVCYSVFVAAGNSVLPNAINLTSMWLIRIPFAKLVVGPYGLVGVWIAMCCELTIRGIAFLIFLRSPKWLDTKVVRDAERAKLKFD